MLEGVVLLFPDMFLENSLISINCQPVSGIVIITKYTKESLRKFEEKMLSGKKTLLVHY